ncbi:hypothetical protein BGZ83_000881 [Gryganskiella cystojenkinii]|nr:hypothetical protein BGZ83_000881 [Gryganskiella cystojenkinii]
MRSSNIIVAVMTVVGSVSVYTLAAPATSIYPTPSTSSAPSATPTPTNNATTTNLKVLNYALALEHLEAEFYKAGLAKFNSSAFTDAGFDSKVRDRFVHIGEHENDHVTTLTSAINSMKGKPVPACQYKFPMDNVTQFLAVAQALENTGVSAYLGAASGGLTGKLLTTAASIATVEARHAAYLNELWNQTAFPYSMDTPLDPRSVVTLAMNLIQSCPYDLGVMPYNQLNATLPSGNSTMVTTSFSGKGNSTSSSTYCQFIYGDDTEVSPRSNCSLPTDASGYIYLVITDSKTPITMSNSTHILAGPALLFNGAHGNDSNSTNSA